MKICDRCGKTTSIYIMSMFNTQEICLDCKDQERQDPRYQEALKAERESLQHGERNFPGIGWKGQP